MEPKDTVIKRLIAFVEELKIKILVLKTRNKNLQLENSLLKAEIVAIKESKGITPKRNLDDPWQIKGMSPDKWKFTWGGDTTKWQSNTQDIKYYHT